MCPVLGLGRDRPAGTSVASPISERGCFHLDFLRGWEQGRGVGRGGGGGGGAPGAEQLEPETSSPKL